MGLLVCLLYKNCLSCEINVNHFQVLLQLIGGKPNTEDNLSNLSIMII